MEEILSLLNQLIFTEAISEFWLIYSNLILAIWISQILLIISRFWLIHFYREYTLFCMHATLTSKCERNVICSRHVLEAFVDLFRALFLCLKDHFCVSRMVLSHPKIYNSDERVGEERIDWLGIKKIYRSFRR